jgi:HD-GYP domain-containing protein (c-di-GMP phosphodiesterase class II)
VPAEILSKPTRLSAPEFELIKTHSETGYKILKEIDFEWPIAEIVHQHHERIDGSGYPLGLKGKEMLLEAKIIGVADVVEAMASHRPYRPALGIEMSLSELEKNCGRFFDSNVVDACLKLFREDGYDLPDAL